MPLSQEAYRAKMTEFQRTAVTSTEMGVKTAAFWKMENLSVAFLRNATPGQSLNDPKMPVEVRPIAHCGMGIAAVEVSGFQAARLMQIIDGFSDPEYRLFAYEGAGAMMSLYQSDWFGFVARGFNRLGVLQMASLTRPDDLAFLRAFDPEIKRLIAHGYGRMVYFKTHNIATAIHEARRSQAYLFDACVQGIAFAYSMVNNSDLHRVFRAGRSLIHSEMGQAFSAGLIYAIEFWEWMAPGFIDKFEIRESFETSLFQAARDGIAASRARGPLLPFALEPSCAAALKSI
jgi:hypothetical protein